MMRRLRAGALLSCLACCLAAQVSVGTTPPWDDDPIVSTYRPEKSAPVLIRNATVLDGAGARIEQGDVLIRNGRVEAIGSDLPAGTVREIDAAGLWLTPGIIDVHSHNGTYVYPLSDIDKEASDVSEGRDVDVSDTWIETAIDPQDPAFARALSRGVTTIQVLPGSSPIFGGHAVTLKPVPAATVAGMKFPGAPYGFKMACGENPKATGGKFVETKDWPTSRAGVYEYMRQHFEAARDFLSRWKAGESVEQDARKAALAGILAGDIILNVHCYRASDMSVMLNLAKEYGFHIATFHHASEAYKIADELREAGTCSAVWSWWGFKRETIDATRAGAAILQQKGACVMMHSDSGLVGQYLNLEAAKAEGAGRRIGLHVPEEQMIRWITSTPAAALGLGERIGTIAPSYAADLVVWNANPFSVYARPKLVMIDGAVRFNAEKGPRPSDPEVGRAEPEEISR